MTRRLRIFLSSPGDVGEERALARRVIARVQGAFRGSLSLEPVIWEDEPLSASEGFQTQIDRPSTCDILVAILWTRIGTPLPATITRADGTPYASGTEFEIEEALEAARTGGKPQVLIYEKTARPALLARGEHELEAAIAQRKALRRFLDRLRFDDRDGSLKSAWSTFHTPSQFEEILELHLMKLVARLVPPAEDDVPATLRWPFGSPFRGLESFDVEHAAIFFGRGAAVSEALARLKAQAATGHPFLLVVGASGLGKSSLVKAGLLPLLMQDGVVEEVAAWRYAILRPMDAPGRPVASILSALTESTALPGLDPGADEDLGLVVDRLVALGIEGAATRVASLLSHLAREAGGPVRLVLVVDQLEELFTDPNTDDGAIEAAAMLLSALIDTGAVWIIATLRSDRYPDLARSPHLLALKAAGAQLDLGAPTGAEIGQLIRLPAASAGLAFEVDPAGRSLEEVLRDAALGNPASLPLLEFTLEELYRARTSDGLLTFAAYEALGGLEGALGQRAEAVFAGLGAQAQASLGLVLAALVRVGDDEVALARRRAPASSLPDAGSLELVRAFIEARLFVSELSALGEPSITLAHEALLAAWPRIEAWADQNRDLVRMRTRLEAAAERWLREERRTDYLLAPGKPLLEALEVERSGLALNADQLALVRLSAARAQRQRSLRRAAVSGLAVLAVAASAGAVVAFLQAEEARRQAVTASRTGTFLQSLFASIDPSEAMGRTITAREIVDKGAREIRSDAALAREPAVRSALLTSIGKAYTGLALYGEARENLAAAHEARVDLYGAFDPRTLESLIELATAQYHAGEFEAVTDLVRPLIDEPAGGVPAAQRIALEKLMGLALIEAGDVEEGLGHVEAARRSLDAAHGDAGDRAIDAGDLAFGAGIALSDLGRLDEAAASLNEALRLRRMTYPEGHSHILEVEAQIAWVLSLKCDRAGAAKLYRDVLSGMERIFGPAHPEVAVQLNNLGRVVLMDGAFGEAEDLLIRALAIEEAAKGAESFDLLFPLNSLGQALMGQGALDDAREALGRALAIAEREGHWMRGPVLTNLADLSCRAGRFDEAIDLAALAEEMTATDFPPAEYPQDAWRLALLEGIAAEAKGGEEALAIAIRSLERLRAAHGEGHLYVKDAEARLKRMKARRG